jgi:microcystin-dependent protein
MDFLVGQIIPFAGNFAPTNWKLCDGALLPIAGHTALFSILGTTYGGDGKVTFGLPNLQGGVVISNGRAASGTTFELGQVGGAAAVTLTAGQMPRHSHRPDATLAIHANDSRADLTEPAGGALAQTEAPMYAQEPDGSTMNTKAIGSTIVVDPAGGSMPMPTMSPYLAINYIICVKGTFPQRP